jgi:hypothetical protein
MFDLFIFLANLLIVPHLHDWVSATQGFDTRFGWLMLAAIILHGLGAGLKSRPLRARLAEQPEWGGYACLLFLVLGVMHLVLFIACANFAAEVLEVTPTLEILLTFGVGLLPTIFTVWVLVPSWKKHEPDQWAKRKEQVADVLIYISLVIILVWWDGFIVGSVAGAGQGNIFMTGLLVILMSVPFAMFYLAPRMLFLLEDFRCLRTWLTAVIAMSPTAWRLVMG